MKSSFPEVNGVQCSRSHYFTLRLLGLNPVLRMLIGCLPEVLFEYGGNKTSNDGVHLRVMSDSSRRLVAVTVLPCLQWLGFAPHTLIHHIILYRREMKKVPRFSIPAAVSYLLRRSSRGEDCSWETCLRSEVNVANAVWLARTRARERTKNKKRIKIAKNQTLTSVTPVRRGITVFYTIYHTWTHGNCLA